MNPIGKTSTPSLPSTTIDVSVSTSSAKTQGGSINAGKAASSEHVKSAVDDSVTSHVKVMGRKAMLDATSQPAVGTDSGSYEKLDAPASPASGDTAKTAQPQPPATGKTGSSQPAATPATKAAGPAAYALPKSNITFGRSEQNFCYGKLSLKAKWHAISHGLSTKEAAAIHAYTRDEYYRDINATCRALPQDGVDLSDASALQKAGVSNPDLAGLIAALASGMKKLPPVQVDDAYFTAVGRNLNLPDADLALLQEGSVVPMKGFMSTTVSQQEMVTDRWWDRNGLALFVYQAVGGNGRDVSMFSEFPVEKEILFLPNTKFEVMFRGAPTTTQPGLGSKGNTKPNPRGATVPKLLIALREVPDDKPAPIAMGDSKASSYAAYFGMR